ncbi:WecB/TagA/CpsF family glycosyltransferase [Spongisporangium articulatum]|uniref:WecB/TagA/CpsF family glycosyltransferase n=1 Tax=Spongisporangium articulatum TaxID=3362603 RepID=A0ABW8AT76_9ACTN
MSTTAPANGTVTLGQIPGQLTVTRPPRSRTVLPLRSVRVGPFAVADSSAADLVERLGTPLDRRVVAFALHVGGLNSRRDHRFVRAMRRADVVYTDGKSVELLARAAGARSVQRAATTDIGLPVIRRLGENLGRPARVAVVGARPGVAERAAATIVAETGAVVVHTDHGYHAEWAGPLAEIRRSDPDVVVIGLGMPLEAVMVDARRQELPEALILTCGGWLGFLAGLERRAPELAQRSGLEWAFRMRQQPRLARRYAHGLFSVAGLYVTTSVRRTARRTTGVAGR